MSDDIDIEKEIARIDGNIEGLVDKIRRQRETIVDMDDLDERMVELEAKIEMLEQEKATRQ